MIDQLIEIIGREAALFESFLELLERQQRMLVLESLHPGGRLRKLAPLRYQ